jgi:hypothetical protein
MIKSDLQSRDGGDRGMSDEKSGMEGGSKSDRRSDSEIRSEESQDGRWKQMRKWE